MKFLLLRSVLHRVIQIVTIAIVCLLLVAPVLAIDNSTATIVLDGRPLFEVSKSGEYTAQKRAADANLILKQEVKSAKPPVTVEIDDTRALPVILVNDKHLLSVISTDAPRGRSVGEQAQLWKIQLKEAIAIAQYERTPVYISRAGVLSFGIGLLAVVLSWGLGWIWRRWLKPLLEKDAVDSPSALSTEIAVKILLKLIQGGIWLYTLIYISRLFPQTRQFSRDIVYIFITSLTSDLFSLGSTPYSVLDFLILIGLFMGLTSLAKTVRKLLQTRVLRLTRLNRGAQETIAAIANYGLIFIGTIVVLQIWGLDISSLTVFAGVLGVGIGLGIQGIAKEFLSGIVLMFEHPIQVGDFVDVGGSIGTVERISFRSTEIITPDEVSVILPNSRFLESEVINWSHRSSVSRLKIPIGVAYGSNLNVVRSALIDAAKAHGDVLSEPHPRVFFTRFGDSSLDFDLLVWTSEPSKQFQIKSDLYFRIETIFRHRGVEIPFPQRDLHLRSSNLSGKELSSELLHSLLADFTKSSTQNHNHKDSPTLDSDPK